MHYALLLPARYSSIHPSQFFVSMQLVSRVTCPIRSFRRCCLLSVFFCDLISFMLPVSALSSVLSDDITHSLPLHFSSSSLNPFPSPPSGRARALYLGLLTPFLDLLDFSRLMAVSFWLSWSLFWRSRLTSQSCHLFGSR
jgi:hypothetical protein